jgi:hypothetical protein
MRIFILFTPIFFVLFSPEISKVELLYKGKSKNVQCDIKKSRLHNADTLNIIIDSLDDNSLLTLNVWGNDGYLFSNNYFQERIINDFQNLISKNKNPVKFYKEDDALKNNIKADLVIELKFLNLDTPHVHFMNSTRSEVIQDFAENTVYPINQFDNSRVSPPGNSGVYYSYSTITTSEDSYSNYIKGAVELNIKNEITGKEFVLKKAKRIYEWNQDTDPDHDFSQITKEYKKLALEEMLENLYKKIYPQIKNQIKKAIN